ncbi:21008_t:CDS:2, partial [Racocetra persica]
DIQKATNQEELNVLNDRINELNYGNLPPEKKQVFLEALQKNQRDKILEELEKQMGLEIGTNWEHKEQIRKKKEFFINEIRAEEAKQFLEKALEIAELEMSELEGNDFIAELRQIENSEQKIINFRISAFKEIVEKGINRALKNENPHVPYNKLTGDPKSSILQENSEQDKLNAFAETLSQIKTKRQRVAEDLLQGLINEETPNNHSELQNYLNNLQRLIPHNNNAANRTAERKNSDNTDIKLSIDQTEISENLKKLRIIVRSKDKPEEIKALSVLGNLPENSNWEKRTQNRINELKAEIANEIESLREYLLTSDKQKRPLKDRRNKRYEELEKINKSIKKMNETEVWKELKELYQKTIDEINNFMTTSEGREKLSKKNFVAYTSLNPQNLFNQAINKIQESIRNCSSAEEIDNQLGPAIKELEKDLNNKIYGLKL